MTDFTKAAIMRWLDEHGRTSDPALDGLRYAAAHTPIDLAVINLDPEADGSEPRPSS